MGIGPMHTDVKGLTGAVKEPSGTMSAVAMRDGGLELIETSIPQPGPGEVLVRTLATGICGSDLHTVAHGAELLANARAVAGVELFDPNEPVVLGHEFCAEVVEYGPGTRGTHAPGTPRGLGAVPASPGAGDDRHGRGRHPGRIRRVHGAVRGSPRSGADHVPSDIAAMAEPLAVALHAVNRGALGSDDVPIVIGCGPIGLAVIAVLKMRGVGPIIAADFSAARRAMADRTRRRHRGRSARDLAV